MFHMSISLAPPAVLLRRKACCPGLTQPHKEETVQSHFTREDGTLRLPSNCVLVRRDGSEIPIEHSIAAIHDCEGQATGAVIVIRDVSLSRAMALQIAHSAEHDFLTGLPNRLLLYDRIHQAIAAAPRQNKKWR
jgi:hypothetical protein